MNRRTTSIALSLAVHGGVIAIAFLLSGAKPALSHREALVAFDVAMPEPGSAPARRQSQPRLVPPDPRPVIPPPLVEVSSRNPALLALMAQVNGEPEPAPVDASSMLAGVVGGCDLTAPVQAALQADPQVARLLEQIPSQHRSVANAMALWNLNWIEPDQTVDPQVYASVKTAVTTAIDAASDDCRLQPQAGPRLVYLQSHGDMTVLALGSGDWTWQQVADTARPQLAMADGPAVASPARHDLMTMVGAMFSQ